MNDKALPKRVEDNPQWAANGAAKEESDNWDKEDTLRGQERSNQIRLLWCLGYIVPIIVGLLSLLFVIAFTSWTLHYILHADYHWLTPEQLSKIQSIIFSGAMGAIVSGYLKSQISNKD